MNLFTLKDNLYSIVSTPIDINVSINPFGLKNVQEVDPNGPSLLTGQYKIARSKLSCKIAVSIRRIPSSFKILATIF